MKKTYIAPKTVSITVHTTSIMETSNVKIGGSYNGSTTIEAREDNGWDIWGNNADDDYEGCE